MSRVGLMLHSTSPEQTETIGEALARVLRPGDVLTLDGPLGAGKTRLVRGIAAGLGVSGGEVSSPTFVIVAEHAGRGGVRLAHADAYRLTGPEDLESVGWDRVQDGDAIVVVEWGERVAGALGPEHFVARARLSPTGTTARRIDLDVPAAWALRAGWTALELLSTLDTACPTCRGPANPSGPASPFCCERCRLVDLGKWLTERHVIPGDRGTDASPDETDRPRIDEPGA
ncbi:MAG: tRNA (adenosine(37)-N6)-threonylcarbamoyltransferase complex ATPase subunit type 1 TsaE [Phycisphaerae bacterium]|nr:tRNA (adenosine(37)-N6)-threonylcarbamoyltransferase complex ATPase subunit type 1 TsaE [Phycisphaerae bacterium]